ncbi:asparagine synthase (glutamine-hydrolyzing) [Pelagibacterales bacterium SAG-MED39]|nr:asparagine synthase (glutamine-hydrolyzing) [Pelagibacterales bacterium SAG-MED39]
MCGIVGYKSKKNLKLNKSKLIETIHHRGPNYQNFVEIKKNKKTYNNIFLGSSRLSIIDDKKRSNQPFSYKNLILCYNGEIYNFKSIKKELIKSKKIKFITNSDTEVLIKSIYYFGLKKTLDIIEGMWAFALYNAENENLILCRDRFGEKPLLYTKEKNDFYFCSELPAFKIFLKNKFRKNLDYLQKYIFYDYRYLNKNYETFFNKIKKVPQGSYLLIDKNLNIKTYKYFNFLDKKVSKVSYKGIIKKTKKKMLELTKNSMVSDKPIGFCLSGGIDSTGLVSIAKKCFYKDIKCFTIYTDDKKYDEFDMVNKTVKALNIKHKWIKVDKNKTFENLKKIIKHRAYPVLTVTSYIQWLMFREISKHKIKVVLSGNGADETFSGYYDHHLAYLNDIESNKQLKRKSLLNWKKKIKPLIRNPLMKDYVNYKSKKKYLQIIKGQNYSKEFSKNNYKKDFSEKKFSKSLLKNRMINEMFHESVPVILQEEDINSMNFSIENRSPYLNKDLYQLLINSPVSHFINDGYAKSILRESLKGVGPKHVLKNYEKVGFNISGDKLLNFKSKKIINFIKKKSPIYSIINKQKILNSLKDQNMISKNSNFLFKFVCAKIFLEIKT